MAATQLLSIPYPMLALVLNREHMRTTAAARSPRRARRSAASVFTSALLMAASVLSAAQPGTAVASAKTGISSGHPGSTVTKADNFSPDGPQASRPSLEAQEHSGTFGDGGVLTYGGARFFGSPTGVRLAAPIVAMAPTLDGGGYWLVGADGGVLTYGDARYHGSAGHVALHAPIVAMAATPDGEGYWLVAADGGVFTFGDAGYYGSPTSRGIRVPDPIVGFAATPDGKGYWMATTHGAVYSYGDARYYGSLGATHLHNIPVVDIASSADGHGYWIVQGGGEVIAYGDAPKLGGMRGHPPVSGIAVTRDGRGYWLVCGNGEVDAFGDARYLGGNSNSDPRPPISAIIADPTGGYWLLDTKAFPVSLSHPSPGWGPGQRIVSVAASQLGPSRGGANYCNPYGPCEEWCALFATWVWEQAGIGVPRLSFVGNVYHWAVAHTLVISARSRPVAGDLVLYGSGPQSAATSPHIGVVAQVWPDGEIDTIEGDAGPGPGGWTSVLVNGPYLPSQSYFANGVPIYGFAVP